MSFLLGFQGWLKHFKNGVEFEVHCLPLQPTFTHSNNAVSFCPECCSQKEVENLCLSGKQAARTVSLFISIAWIGQRTAAEHDLHNSVARTDL
jgi:hypothetical protein